MKPDKPTQRDANQGEGDRIAARSYNEQLREFIAGGKVEPAARGAASYVAREEAGHTVRKAARGFQTHISLDEMVSQNRSVLERMRPVAQRVMGKLRSRFGRK